MFAEFGITQAEAEAFLAESVRPTFAEAMAEAQARIATLRVAEAAAFIPTPEYATYKESYMERLIEEEAEMAELFPEYIPEFTEYITVAEARTATLQKEAERIATAKLATQLATTQSRNVWTGKVIDETGIDTEESTEGFNLAGMSTWSMIALGGMALFILFGRGKKKVRG